MQVTQATVSLLVKKVKKNPEFFHELMEKKEIQKRERKEIADYITELNKSGQIIDSVKSL